MKNMTLTLSCEGEMDCPKEIVIWNYYDHEHLIGTHYKLYDNARVVYERDDMALVYRSKQMPFLPFYTGGLALQYMEGNIMKTVHHDSNGFLLEMQVKFDDLPNNRCRTTTTYTMNVHPVFKIFEPIFKLLFKRWFYATWEEDAPMRLRRWKVHQLGFKDFYGIDYINKTLSKPLNTKVEKYEFNPPIPTLTKIKSKDGEDREYNKGIELGYRD